MNERDLAVLEQYDLTVKETWRGRGSYICVTDRGKKILQEYRGSEARARCQMTLLQQMREHGYENVDLPVQNQEGCIVTKDRDGVGYILKDYMDGRECDVGNRDELLEAAANLARIHVLMKMLPAEEINQTETFAQTAKRHNREMKKVRSFIRAKKSKTDFELYVLQYFSMFYEKGIRVQEALADAAFTDMTEMAVRNGCWRHGEYTQHNVLFTRNGTATVNFEHCAPDLPLEDVAHFMRKIMEKYDWDETMGQQLLTQYARICPLDAQARRYLGWRLSYPEKFWKLLNRYYSLSKAWISERSSARLVRLVVQETKKEAFVRRLLQ